MGKGPTWTREETIFLQNEWGTISIPTIAQKLGRSVNAIKLKAARLGLGNHLHAGDYITVFRLIKALGYSGGGYKETIKKLQKYGFPFRYKNPAGNMRYMVVRLDEFWKWAARNKKHLDFANFEWGMLGVEPEWVPMKRKADQINRLYGRGRKDRWTEHDDQLLIKMLSEYRWTYTDLSKRLKRTEAAIKRRMITQGIKMRPVIADKQNKWTDKDADTALKLHKKGLCPDAIAAKLKNKSALAVAGKLERM